ncbi:hypothetical protein [Haloferula rosea]|uniref:Uncharacterized protein n=1 Tax=Haloferula rosea TaxID=490093 RepID=A0A934RFZ9_9BACT|nr:hypothetical protein [Haloferula rosea]MBK1828807.1 hypothetical protein [Haloferula rosea]
MRGSPLIRTLFLVLALGLTGLGIYKLTRPSPAVAEAPVDPPPSEAPELLETPFFLTLSDDPELVSIESAGKTVEIRVDSRTHTGTIHLESGHPTIFITVQWRTKDPAPRFAKLSLEPPGLPTQQQVFDAMGEISDVWEPHIH